MGNKWKQFKLLDVAQLRMGETLIKNTLTGFGKPIFSADRSEEPWAFSEKTKLSFSRGSLVVGARGTLGSIKLPKFDEFTATQTTIVVIPNDKILPEFLYYFLRSFDFLKIKEGVGIPMISIKNFQKVKISLPVDKNGNPDLAEQKRIVDILEEAEELKKKRAEADRKMDELVPAIFSEMFGDLSKFELRRLGDDLAVFKYGTSVPCGYEKNGLPVLRIPNVLGDKINCHDLKYGEIEPLEMKKLTLVPGDILFVRTNGNPEYVGRCGVFDLEGEFLFASYLIRARLDMNRLIPVFLATYLRSETGRSVFLPAIRTTAGQSNINTEGLKNIKTPLPPIELQNQFAERVKDIEIQREKQKQSTKKIDELFQSLLSRVFSENI